MHSLIKILYHIFAYTLYKRGFQAFLYTAVTPNLGRGLLCSRTVLLELCCNGNKTFSSIGTAVEHHILHDLAEFKRDIFVLHCSLRIHYSHIHSGRNGVIQEHRVQCLAHIVVTAEREREVAHSAAYVRTRQVLLYPCTGTDEVDTVCGMLLNTRSNGKDIGVEYYIIRGKAHLLCQQFIGSAAHLDLALEGGCLPVLIKRHDNDRRSKALGLACTG